LEIRNLFTTDLNVKHENRMSVLQLNRKSNMGTVLQVPLVNVTTGAIREIQTDQLLNSMFLRY